MFFSLFIIFVFGIAGGMLFEKIKLPRLIWYIILGILIGPSVLNLADSSLLSISSYLRQIALVIILTRSGLSLDLKILKKIGRPAVLMCFVPACFEIIGITIFAPLVLKIGYFEAMLLGSVLAAVSPAVVVPRMIHLIEEGYGKKHGTPELVMAGASCDDIFVIVLFYSFKNLVEANTFSPFNFIQIPISILSGILLGMITGVGLVYTLKKIHLNPGICCILLLGLSFGMLALEAYVKPYFSISALLGIIVMAMMVSIFKKDIAKEVQKSYNSLWLGFEPFLFVLVGCATDIRYAFSVEGAIIAGLICIALVFRSIGVICCLVATKFNWKEKIFIIISYLPKATVQASIGAIALAEGLACGATILTAAVISILITAPIGAFLMDNLSKKLLVREYETIVEKS